jgi:hypothetical protein
MVALEQFGATPRSWVGFLDRDRTIAKPGFSRWMVPPAALCVHLRIGQAYAFSVFNLPMTRLLGISPRRTTGSSPSSVGSSREWRAAPRLHGHKER